MLKIKDNIDLKELEKFGFEKTPFSYYSKQFNYKYCTVWIDIETTDRFIYIENDYLDNDYSCEIPGVIYDLIEAGLVEKVEDK